MLRGDEFIFDRMPPEKSRYSHLCCFDFEDTGVAADLVEGAKYTVCCGATFFFFAVPVGVGEKMCLLVAVAAFAGRCEVKDVATR